MESPQISVIIPTFNRPDLLREALESVRAQVGVSFEIIVVNDAGVSVSGVVAEFRDSFRVDLVSLDTNAGLPAARNVGVRKSSGRYIAYLDDDDIYLPGHLACLAERLDRNPEVGLVYSDALLEKQQRKGETDFALIHRRLAVEYDLAVMLRDSFICPSAVMHRRECIESLGGFDESMRWCYEDWDFFLKVGSHFQIERVAGESVKVRLRHNGSNMSSSTNSHRKAAADTLRSRYGCGEIKPKTFWEVAESLGC